jgi:hypothetical protein
MKKLSIILIIVIALFFSIGAFIKIQQHNPIIGTWRSAKDYGAKLVFTADKKKVYYDGELLATYTYKVTKKPIQCGVDMNARLKEFPSERILVETNIKTYDKDCQLIYALTDSSLTLSAFGYYQISYFRKVKN